MIIDMHYHNQQVPTHYRVCGQRITKYRAKKRECRAFSAELKIAFDIDTSGDDVNIHPEMFCTKALNPLNAKCIYTYMRELSASPFMQCCVLHCVDQNHFEYHCRCMEVQY